MNFSHRVVRLTYAPRTPSLVYQWSLRVLLPLQHSSTTNCYPLSRDSYLIFSKRSAPHRILHAMKKQLHSGQQTTSTSTMTPYRSRSSSASFAMHLRAQESGMKHFRKLEALPTSKSGY